MKQAMNAISDKAWDKAMHLTGMDKMNSEGGGRGKVKEDRFTQVSDEYDRSQSTDPTVNKDYMTASQGAESALMQFSNSVGSVGQQINQVFTSAFRSVSSNLSSAIMGTETWRKALGNVVATIEGSVVSSIINMGMKWVTTQILMAVQGKSIAAGSAAAMLPIAAAESEIWAAPAALATIASWGGAAIAAPELVLASVLGTQALAAFEMGGFTGGVEGAVAGVVHGGEYVMSAPAVRAIGKGNLDRMHDMAKSGGGDETGAGGGSLAAGSGHHLYIVNDMHEAIAKAHNNPAVRKSIISIANGRVRGV